MLLLLPDLGCFMSLYAASMWRTVQPLSSHGDMEESPMSMQHHATSTLVQDGPETFQKGHLTLTNPSKLSPSRLDP